MLTESKFYVIEISFKSQEESSEFIQENRMKTMRVDIENLRLVIDTCYSQCYFGYPTFFYICF